MQQDLDSKLDPMGKKMTVNELIDRYLQTRTGVKPNRKSQDSYRLVIGTQAGPGCYFIAKNNLRKERRTQWNRAKWF